MASDTLKLDTPAGEVEWEYLSTVKVGDVRKSELFPAFDVPVVWTCSKIHALNKQWTFEGKFCGVPVLVMEITEFKSTLLMTLVSV